ncbi:MAG: hypothetical protein JWR37_2329 [Mycobacterium sp.]|nr:hypothetical protein [Mycobacterium sp.]
MMAMVLRRQAATPRHKDTLRSAAVIGALRISPRMLGLIHPARNRAQNALRRDGFCITGGRSR